MRFYTGQHEYYCGVDLHARTLYLCVLDAHGKKRLHKRVRSEPVAFLEAVEPYREGLVVGVECIFCWYWLADLCASEQIAFVLGHAFYMKAIHGAKAKNDQLDSHKLAVMLRGGSFPEAYVYPRGMRATRDLLRRRLFFVRKRGELFAHVRNNCRLVKSQHTSDGKRTGSGGSKIGNAHLKWAFSEASVLFLKGTARGQAHLHRLQRRHGKGKALSILAARIGRAVYFHAQPQPGLRHRTLLRTHLSSREGSVASPTFNSSWHLRHARQPPSLIGRLLPLPTAHHNARSNRRRALPLNRARS